MKRYASLFTVVKRNASFFLIYSNTVVDVVKTQPLLSMIKGAFTGVIKDGVRDGQGRLGIFILYVKDIT